jgi:aryl-alcohol dehydrogenase-like predicted oxidoreductase
MELVLGSQHSSGTFNGLMVLGRNADRAVTFYQRAMAFWFRTVDTAPLYARGGAEFDLGQAVWSGRVWTKIGVDIDGILARPNYSIEAMVRSLSGSARRLGRVEFDLVWIHNPDVVHLRELSLPSLLEGISQHGMTVRSFGVSVRDIEVWRHLIDAGSFDGGVSALMLEASLAEEHPLMFNVSRARFSHAIRGALLQGRALANVMTDNSAKVSQAISGRISQLAETLDPGFLVCGPRTIEHLEAYRDLVKLSCKERTRCGALPESS